MDILKVMVDGESLCSYISLKCAGCHVMWKLIVIMFDAWKVTIGYMKDCHEIYIKRLNSWSFDTSQAKETNTINVLFHFSIFILQF